MYVLLSLIDGIMSAHRIEVAVAHFFGFKYFLFFDMSVSFIR